MADGVKRFRQVNEDRSCSFTSVRFLPDKVCKESDWGENLKMKSDGQARDSILMTHCYLELGFFFFNQSEALLISK